VVFEVKVDRVGEIPFKEAIEGCVYVARREGLLIGLSSGAVTAAFSNYVEISVQVSMFSFILTTRLNILAISRNIWDR